MEQNWYDNLNKSPLNPPSWVFGPVWTVLYTLMFLSLFFYKQADYTRSSSSVERSETSKGVVLFFIQLILNLYWPNVFFKQKKYCRALINITLLNIFVFLTFLEFLKKSKIAGILLIPYMLWILFATYLNYYICTNN